MPTFQIVERYPYPPLVVFDFFRRPGNVVAVAPESLGLLLIEGPEVVSAGDRFSVQVKRFGLSRRIDTEVLTLEPTLVVECQVNGPFREWRLERRFADEDGTVLTETVIWEPPGGLLGLAMTAAVVEGELTRAYEGRAQRVLLRLSAT
jgi:ligand-binding SRPBCC domain-containing protein